MVYAAAAWCLVGPLMGMGLAGCKPKPPTVVLTRDDGTTAAPAATASPADEAAATKLAEAADALEHQGDRAGAQQKRDALVKQYPSTAAAADLYESRARAASDAGNKAEAVTQYEHLLFYRPNHPRVDEAREKYATLLLDVGRFADAENMLQALYRAAKSSVDQRRLGQPLVEAQVSVGHIRAALEVLVELSQQAGLPEGSKRQYLERAGALVASNLGFSEAEGVWSSSEGQPAWLGLQPVIAFKLAKIYYHTRDYVRSEDMLKLLSSRFPQSPYAAQARDFLEHLRSRFEVDGKAVGVVLPLSGKYEQFGKRSLAAISLHLAAKGPYKLVIKDSQGEPNVAAQAVESLVLENHVVAIIGPLFSSEAMAAALKAEELSVPLLALSHREGLPEIGPFVFRIGLTIKAQAKALAKVAFDDLGFTNFALLYPRSRYGIEFTNSFWDEVDRRHGAIRGAETYEPDQTTFREPVRRLVGRWYMGARGDFREALDALKRQKLSPLRLRSEMEKLDKTLPPIVDFDAVIIPDSGRQIGLIAPALAFEDVVLTHDPKTLEKIRKSRGDRDVQPITLAGASTWNTAQTLDSCESYCEDAIFVDAYFPNSTDPKVRDFIASFREANAGADPQLSEAQAYDTAGWLKVVLGSANPQSRKAMREALATSGPYHGITGKMTFDEQGDAQRDLFALTIKEHAIRLFERPAETPRG